MTAKKKAKRTVRKKHKPPTVKQLVSRVEKEFGAKAGTPELREAVKRFNAACVAGWLCTVNADGSSVFVRGFESRFYDARAEAVKLINGARIAADPKCALVSIDGVTLEWRE